MSGGGVTDVWGQVVGAALGVAGNVAGSGAGGANGADSIFGPSMLSFDGSGWAVNFGAGNQDLNNSNRGAPSLDNTAGMPGSRVSGGGGLGELMQLPPLVVLGGVLVLALLLRRR